MENSGEIKTNGTKDPQIKNSRRLDVQERIDKEKERLKIKRPERSEEDLHLEARDKVAARIVRERLRKEVQRALKEAQTDFLTGLLNRLGIEKEIEEQSAKLARHGETAVLVALDADGLKKINDEQGHQAGDALLRKIASSLLESTRASDVLEGFVSRPGGDEFYVLLTGTDLEGTKKWWDRTSQLFQERGIKMSAGVALLDPRDVQGSIRKADKASYRAKSLKANGGSRLFQAKPSGKGVKYIEYTPALKVA